MRSSYLCCFFFFNDTATTEIYTLSLHDALPIITARRSIRSARTPATGPMVNHGTDLRARAKPTAVALPVSLLMYTASAMKVTKFPTSEIQSAYQRARSSRSLRTAKMATVRLTRESCMDWRLCGSRGHVPQIRRRSLRERDQDGLASAKEVWISKPLGVGQSLPELPGPVLLGPEPGPEFRACRSEPNRGPVATNPIPGHTDPSHPQGNHRSDQDVISPRPPTDEEGLVTLDGVGQKRDLALMFLDAVGGNRRLDRDGWVPALSHQDPPDPSSPGGVDVLCDDVHHAWLEQGKFAHGPDRSVPAGQADQAGVSTCDLRRLRAMPIGH